MSLVRTMHGWRVALRWQEADFICNRCDRFVSESDRGDDTQLSRFNPKSHVPICKPCARKKKAQSAYFSYWKGVSNV